MGVNLANDGIACGYAIFCADIPLGFGLTPGDREYARKNSELGSRSLTCWFEKTTRFKSVACPNP